MFILLENMIFYLTMALLSDTQKIMQLPTWAPLGCFLVLTEVCVPLM